VPAGKAATFLLDTGTLFISVRNKLLERGKEPLVVVALWIIRPDPLSIDETVEYMGTKCAASRLNQVQRYSPPENVGNQERGAGSSMLLGAGILYRSGVLGI
jgi:hypothetical protein